MAVSMPIETVQNCFCFVCVCVCVGGGGGGGGGGRVSYTYVELHHSNHMTTLL